MSREPILAVDSSHGIYAPQYFVEQYGDDLQQVSAEDFDIVVVGPDNEEYWEAWDVIVRDGLVNFGNKGDIYYIHEEDGDIWLYPADYENED